MIHIIPFFHIIIPQSHKYSTRKKKGAILGIIVWIIFGALIGWVAPFFLNFESRQATFHSVLVGIVGALAGGSMMNLLGFGGITSFNPYTLVAAVISSVVFIWTYRTVATTSTR